MGAGQTMVYMEYVDDFDPTKSYAIKVAQEEAEGLGEAFTPAPQFDKFPYKKKDLRHLTAKATGLYGASSDVIFYKDFPIIDRADIGTDPYNVGAQITVTSELTGNQAVWTVIAFYGQKDDARQI